MIMCCVWYQARFQTNPVVHILTQSLKRKDKEKKKKRRAHLANSTAPDFSLPRACASLPPSAPQFPVPTPLCSLLPASAMVAFSPSPPSRWPLPPRFLALPILLCLGCLAAPASVRAAGVLRQVVVGGGGGGTFFEPFNVTYDHRAVILGGERRMLVSAGLHYPRATPEVSTELCLGWAAAASIGGMGRLQLFCSRRYW